MKKLFNTEIYRGITVNALRGRRYLRPEYLGEYLPKISEEELKKHRTSPFTKYSSIFPLNETVETETEPDKRMERLYPELHPFVELPDVRDELRERLERREMMKRRRWLDVPEFAVGSVLAATVADPWSASGRTRFVGICILRRLRGLLSSFRLRNVVDNIGIEIEYELYNPTLLKIEVLRLERRLDDNLFYLRDAPSQYSAFSFSMPAEPHEAGAPIPVNSVKVPLNSRPWQCKWLDHDYRGIDDSAYELAHEEGRPKHLYKAQLRRNHFERYDLMSIYRERGPLADRNLSMKEVELMHSDLMQYLEEKHRHRTQKKSSRKQTRK